MFSHKRQVCHDLSSILCLGMSHRVGLFSRLKDSNHAPVELHLTCRVGDFCPLPFVILIVNESLYMRTQIASDHKISAIGYWLVIIVAYWDTIRTIWQLNLILQWQKFAYSFTSINRELVLQLEVGWYSLVMITFISSSMFIEWLLFRLPCH